MPTTLSTPQPARPATHTQNGAAVKKSCELGSGSGGDVPSPAKCPKNAPEHPTSG